MSRVFLILLFLSCSLVGQTPQRNVTANPSTGALIWPTLPALNSQAKIYYNLKADAGAKGDGTTDDTAAVQAWLTYASVNHVPIFAEAGTYKCTSAITMATGVSTGNTYGDGLVMIGSGMRTTIFKFTSATDGFVFPHAVQNGTIANFTIQTTVTNSHNALHTDGSVSEDGGIGSGASMNNCVIQNLFITGFTTGHDLDLYYWSNSQVLNCSLDPASICVKLYGSSNSDLFDTVTAGGTLYSYEISAGQGICVRGADINTPASGSAVGIEVDGAVEVTLVNCRCENRGSGFPAEVLSGSSVNFIGCSVANFGGTSAYGLHCGGTVSSINSAFGGVTNGVKLETTGKFTSDGPIGTDYFNPTKTNSWAYSPFWSLGTNDGLAAGAAQVGLIRFLNNHGSAPDNLQFFSQNTGSGVYTLDDLNQYNEDVRSGLAVKTNVANLFTQDQTASSGINYIVKGETGTPGTNVSGGYDFRGATTYKLGGDVITGNDWGLLRVHGGGTGSPRDLLIWSDTSERWHFNWNNTGSAGSTPTGTSGLNNYGTTMLGVAGTSITNVRHGISSAMTLGSVTVTDAGCTANTRYFFATHTIGTITLPASYYVSTRTASTSFVITSSQATDTSTVDWLAIEP